MKIKQRNWLEILLSQVMSYKLSIKTLFQYISRNINILAHLLTKFVCDISEVQNMDERGIKLCKLYCYGRQIFYLTEDEIFPLTSHLV